jgi:hypothetical protein
MPKASGQPTFRTLVATAKKIIKTGELSQAKDLLDSAIDPDCQAVDHLKARYIRATVMFGMGDYGEAQSDLEFCLNNLISNPPVKSDLVVDCLFLWFWATQRQNINPKNQQDFLNLVFSKFPHENLREKLTRKKAPPLEPQSPTPTQKKQRQVRVSC